MTGLPQPRPLSESNVLIAGGTSGVGLATAITFGRAGVPRIALLARNQARGEAAAQQVRDAVPGCEVAFFSADATDPDQLQRAADGAHAMLGTVDVLVNTTTSSAKPELFHNTSLHDIHGLLNGLAMPPMLLSRIVVPWMKEQGGGAIVNVASDAGKVATPGEVVIGAAMAAIILFTRTLAMEAKRDGIRVNVLTPSLIAGTPTSDLVLSGGFSQKLFQKATKMAHLGLTGPQDQANLILFLCSPESARLTGQAISVNGGISAA